MNKSLSYRLEQIIRDLTNSVSSRINDKPFLQTIKKRLKFQNHSDWNVLCSLMDVLSDTELAKENFLKYNLSGPTKILDYGEEYLRLYGILNAIYLQKSAIISFVELVKLPRKKEIITRLESLKIIELRHIVGAHTIDFLDNGNKNPHQFQRGSLNNRIIGTSDSKNNFKEYDLKKLVLEYNEIAETILIDATEKFIFTALKNGGELFDKYKKRLEAVKAEKAGNIVIYPMGFEEEHFIIMVKTDPKTPKIVTREEDVEL